MFFWGHAPNSQTRGPDLKKAMEKLDLLVVVDPHPTVSGGAARPHRRRLPAAGGDPVRDLGLGHRLQPLAAVAREGVRAASSRPSPTTRSCICSPRSSASTKEMFKNIKVESNEPVVEDITREINRGMWTIGYTGQIARAAQAAHGQPAHLRQDDAAGQRRPVRRRLLRPAVALLGHARDEASRARPTSTTPPSRSPTAASASASTSGVEGRPTTSGQERSASPTACWPSTAIRGSEIKDGYPPVSPWACCRSWAGTRTSRAEELADDQEDRRRQARERDVDDRPLGRHPAGGDQARHARRSATARRAASSGTSPTACRCIASRSTRRAATWCRSIRPTRIASSTGCRCCSRRSRHKDCLQGLSDHPDLGPSGRVRGRRRRDALQPVARRAAAEHVRGDQPATTPTISASRTASRSGWRGPRRARSRSWRW